MKITEKQASALADVICNTPLLNTTLRDLFAGFALAGMTARSMDDRHPDVDNTASRAFAYADAMLAKRSTPAGDEG